MIRRLPAAILSLATTLGLALAASLAAQSSAEAPKFDHAEHVSIHWSSQAEKLAQRTGRDGEVARDCRGCHDYRKDVPAAQLAKPTANCVRCHDPEGYWEKEKKQVVDIQHARVDPAEEAARLFKHSSHLSRKDGSAITCAECHYQDTGTPGTPKWEIKIPRENSENKSYCASCHDNENPPAQWSEQERATRERLNEGLTAEAKQRAKASESARAVVFSHAAHLRPEELASATLDACRQCHTSLENSEPDSLAETQFDTNSCVKCHNGLEFKSSPKRADGTPFTVTSPTAGVFSHKQHLGGGTPKAGIKAIGAEGCLACHAFESVATSDSGVRTFELKPFLLPSSGRGAFQGCIACHTEVDVPNHGNTDACARCHVVQASSLTKYSALASNRPMDKVARTDPASFTFELHSHKFISKGQTAGAPESCAQCHKAKLELQPSRIKDRSFSHATHLPAGIASLSTSLANQACKKCHADVATSKSLAGIALAYDESACVECHGKAGGIPTFERSPRSEMHQFDHSQHVGKTGRDGEVVSCRDCHLSSTADNRVEIVLADKIAECTLCHGHPEKSDGRINRFSKAAVDSCARCHAAGVPVKGDVVPVERALLVADGGHQKHSGEARCTSCHLFTPQKAFDENSRQKPTQANIAIAMRTQGQLESPHEARLKLSQSADATPEARKSSKYFFDDVSCVDCHWHSTEPIEHAYTETARKNSTLKRVQDLFKDTGWRINYRQDYGNVLGGEGTEYPSGFPGVKLPKVK